MNANAVLRGDTVTVSSPQVLQPAAVRYGWADFPQGNLGPGWPPRLAVPHR